MKQNSLTQSHSAGLALFADAETFLTDLSENDESMITGGANSVSNSGLTPARRRRLLLARRRQLLLARRRQLLLARRRRQLLLARRRAAANSVSRT